MSTNIIAEMLRHYELNSDYDRKNALKEILQEIILCGLSKGGFFNHAAFYGGTALRIFYGLDRFSEDLDFSLIKPNEDFNLENYFPHLEREIRSFGLNVSIIKKEKTSKSQIKSAFLKANTKEHLLLFFDKNSASRVASNENIKIKIELDTIPPDFATFERKFRLLPAPYEINLYDAPSLFAGKIHAVICRGWKSRVKGRDLYDYVFYLSKGTKVNFKHLQARLSQTDIYVNDLDDVKNLLTERFRAINFSQAKEDVMPFIKNPSSIEKWSSEFFAKITEKLHDNT